ncbi:Ribonuclease 3 [Colletotrichum siamense]|uniref:Ribonuclease 3 n=1 Tax=Colletotrichum siamense TaxID=690259 RepID=A0A9P5K570_COLSI|nr:Ribonuclease 3 [Colletotrichum siamense]KAF4859447.1 Ribonuclease 3 [Colletotrichum siamense]
MNPLQADQRMSDADWLWEALQAAGSPVTRVGTRSLREGNKQLAGLGDRIISVVIVMTSVDDNISIGNTNARIQMCANNERLARLCDAVGLTRCIVRNPSQQGMVSQRTKADTLEAVVGAVFKDGGLDAAEEVIERLGIIELLVTLQTLPTSHVKSVIKMTLNSVLYPVCPRNPSVGCIRRRGRRSTYGAGGNGPWYSTDLVDGALLSIRPG